MALDEPNEQDSRHEFDGIPVIVSQDQENYFGPVLRVHYVESASGAGFSISRTMPGFC